MGGIIDLMRRWDFFHLDRIAHMSDVYYSCIYSLRARTVQMKQWRIVGRVEWLLGVEFSNRHLGEDKKKREKSIIEWVCVCECAMLLSLVMNEVGSACWTRIEEKKKKKARGRGGTFSLLQCDMHVHLSSDLLVFFSFYFNGWKVSTVCTTSSPPPVYSNHICDL